MHKSALKLAIMGLLVGWAGSASAAPDFRGMHLTIICPEFDDDKKPDKDDEPLFSLSRRVFPGPLRSPISSRYSPETCRKISSAM